MAIRSRQRSRPGRAETTYYPGRHRGIPRDPSTIANSGRTPGNALALAGDTAPGPPTRADRLGCGLFGTAKRERMCLATLDHEVQDTSRAVGVPLLEVSSS